MTKTPELRGSVPRCDGVGTRSTTSVGYRDAAKPSDAVPRLKQDEGVDRLRPVNWIKLSSLTGPTVGYLIEFTRKIWRQPAVSGALHRAQLPSSVTAPRRNGEHSLPAD